MFFKTLRNCKYVTCSFFKISKKETCVFKKVNLHVCLQELVVKETFSKTNYKFLVSSTYVCAEDFHQVFECS